MAIEAWEEVWEEEVALSRHFQCPGSSGDDNDNVRVK
jgi:hypothetical protein